MLFRSLVAHDLAGVQFDHAFAHGVDDLFVVRGHDDGGAVRLMASNTSMMPSDVVGSRLPVGSSASRI